MRVKTKPQWKLMGDTFIEPCDVKGCRFDFHQYAIHSDSNSNRLLVTDMDGNEEYETDSYLECVTKPEVLRDYLRSVVETGNDYLGVLMVTNKRPQTWTITLANWLGNSTRGMMIVRGRRVGRKSVLPLHLPRAVKDYLEMDESKSIATTKAVHSLAELQRLQREGDFHIVRNNGAYTRIKFSLDVPFTPTQSKRAIMKAARKVLAKGATL